MSRERKRSFPQGSILKIFYDYLKVKLETNTTRLRDFIGIDPP